MLIDSLQEVIGSAPDGLEFLEYTFAFIVTCLGLILLFSLIKMFFKKFL